MVGLALNVVKTYGNFLAGVTPGKTSVMLRLDSSSEKVTVATLTNVECTEC
jgi:hypothetical protein